MRARSRLLALSLLVACDHTSPFTTGSNGSSQAFQTGSPRRLTYNTGQDLTPAWLPDETALVYTFQRPDRPDHDRCLGILPPDGGQITRTICDVAAVSSDSTDALSDAAVAAPDEMAYVFATSLIGDITPTSSAIVQTSFADPTTVRMVASFPYFATDTLPHEGASHLRWLGRDTLVYLAERVGYEGHCTGCPRDTVRTGVAIDLLDLSGPTPQVHVLGGTRYASSVAASSTGGVIYFTLGGDSRVYRRVLAGGTDSVVFDFGGAGIARDVQVAGSRLVAVVGGSVTYGFDPVLGYPVQRDSGGPLHLVDLTLGTDVLVSDTLLRHPALSPSGKRLVAELYTGALSDLWEFTLP